MDAITRGVLEELHEIYPKASIRLSHQFLDGYDGKACGLVPHDWDGKTVVFISGQWWRPSIGGFVWISLKDKSPPGYTGVLVTDGRTVTVARKDGEYWHLHEASGYEWEWDFDIYKATHWMPLPEPPNAGDHAPP